MRNFDYSVLKDKKWDNRIVRYIAQIHEFKAKQDLLLSQEPEKFAKLIEIAKRKKLDLNNL